MSHARYAGLFLFALVGCVEHNDALTPPLVQNAARLESDVLSVVITNVSQRSSGTLQILPLNITRFGMAEDKAALEIVDGSLPPSDREAIADFRHRNADSGSMRMPLQLKIPYQWITDNCGVLCGSGNFVRLQRDVANVWHITQMRLAWVS